MAIDKTNLTGWHQRTKSIAVRVLHVHHARHACQAIRDGRIHQYHAFRAAVDTLSWCTPFSKYDYTQALEHEGTRDATGTEVSEGAQERVMAEPQPHQAT